MERLSVRLAILIVSTLLVGCSSGKVETANLPGFDEGVSKPLPWSTVALVYSDGSIRNGSGSTFSSDLSDPRNFCVMKTDVEQLLGTALEVGREALMSDASGPIAAFTNLDPRVVSISKKPDTGEYWALLSYGRVVKLFADGSVDFGAACPFVPGCDNSGSLGFVRFQSISVGTGSDLFVLDHQGRLFKATNLSSPVATYSPRVTSVVYY